MADKTEANRAVVTAFFEQFMGRKDPRGAFMTHVIEGYIQHNPKALDGRQAAIDYLENYLATNPQLVCKVLRIVVDGDLAAVHQHIIRSPGEPGIAVVDMLRLENGKIVEHWDVVQPVPTESLNPHPMF